MIESLMETSTRGYIFKGQSGSGEKDFQSNKEEERGQLKWERNATFSALEKGRRSAVSRAMPHNL